MRRALAWPTARAYALPQADFTGWRAYSGGRAGAGHDDRAGEGLLRLPAHRVPAAAFVVAQSALDGAEPVV